MKQSKVLEKFHNGRIARICSMGHVLPYYIRAAAKLSYDGIWIDLEHRAMDYRESQYLLALCHYNGIDGIIRPATRDSAQLYRYLEDGATGFIMPLVPDAETAREIVEAVKFPPFGNRGFDGAGLDGDFGFEAWRPEGTYTEDANRETIVIVQIETLQALNNAEEIAAVPGVDGLIAGSGDLGRRIDAAKWGTYDEAVAVVAAAARKHCKMWGPGTPSIKKMIDYCKSGATIVPWGIDMQLVKILEDSCKDLDDLELELQSSGISYPVSKLQ